MLLSTILYGSPLPLALSLAYLSVYRSVSNAISINAAIDLAGVDSGNGKQNAISRY